MATSLAYVATLFTSGRSKASDGRCFGTKTMKEYSIHGMVRGIHVRGILGKKTLQ